MQANFLLIANVNVKWFKFLHLYGIMIVLAIGYILLPLIHLLYQATWGMIESGELLPPHFSQMFFI